MRTERVTTKGTKPAKRTVIKTTTDPWNRTGASNLKKELNTWLCNRTVWNHNDWCRLLQDLRTKGFSDLVDTPKGQESIGLYLETNRKYPTC